MRTRGQLRCTARWVAAAVAVLAGLTACTDGSATQPPPSETEQTAGSEPPVTAEVVQLRRDQVLQRVEVAVRNTGRTRLVVESVRLEVPGFRIPGPLPKDSPVFAGGVVNLPVPYDGVDCPASGDPDIGPATVTLRVHPDDDPTATRTATIDAGDGGGLLQRIADRACAVERAARQVDLGFTDRWRIEQTPEGPVAHGELRARLLDGEGLRITQVAGAILYGLRPEDGAPSPLARVTPQRPLARVPVVAYAARCDPHTIGEIKKPYEFLVWVSGADGEELALTPEVSDRDRAALQRVCTF